jgi:hypothetical protein
VRSPLRDWRAGAAGVSRLVPHALLRLLQPEDRLALDEDDPHPLPDRVRLFARERENVAQVAERIVYLDGRWDFTELSSSKLIAAARQIIRERVEGRSSRNGPRNLQRRF